MCVQVGTLDGIHQSIKTVSLQNFTTDVKSRITTDILN